MRTDLTVEAELDDFVARADAGRSVYITRVRQCLEKLVPGTTGIDLVMALEFAGDLPSREFGLRLPVADWPAAAVIWLVTVPVFLLLGMMSCSILMVIKRGDPVYWVFSGAASLLAGTMFPVAVLPPWLRTVSFFMT